MGPKICGVAFQFFICYDFARCVLMQCKSWNSFRGWDFRCDFKNNFASLILFDVPPYNYFSGENITQVFFNHMYFDQSLKTLWTRAKKIDKLPLFYFYKYIIDVLWGQPIRLIQVVSASEFHEYLWNKIVFIFCPFGFLQGLRSLKHLQNFIRDNYYSYCND